MPANTDSTAGGPARSNAVSLRGVDPALRTALEAEAARLGMSLNAVILRVLRDALGLGQAAEYFHDLDALAGSWAPAEAEAFRTAVRSFEEIDQAMWEPQPES
jgi:hypothetical protein